MPVKVMRGGVGDLFVGGDLEDGRAAGADRVADHDRADDGLVAAARLGEHEGAVLDRGQAGVGVDAAVDLGESPDAELHELPIRRR